MGWSELFALALVIPGILVVGFAALYWAVPNHYLISFAYLLTIHWLLQARAGISAGWQSNQSIQPTAESGG